MNQIELRLEELVDEVEKWWWGGLNPLRMEGHSALRVVDGKLEKFDPNPPKYLDVPLDPGICTPNDNRD